MNRVHWRDVRREMRGMAAGRPAVSAAEFWEDFRARARLHPQRTAERAPAVSFIFSRWAWAGACATVVALLAVLPFRGGPAGSREGAVLSLDVETGHSAVVILDDARTRSTIVWIVGADGQDAGGGST